jgi:hypothetical protein
MLSKGIGFWLGKGDPALRGHAKPSGFSGNRALEAVIQAIGRGGIMRAGPKNTGQEGIGSVSPERVGVGAGSKGVRQDVAVQIRSEDGPVPATQRCQPAPQ